MGFQHSRERMFSDQYFSLNRETVFDVEKDLLFVLRFLGPSLLFVQKVVALFH